MTKDRLQINIRIDPEIKHWLDNLPRKISISDMIRQYLHSVMEKQDVTKNENNQETN